MIRRGHRIDLLCPREARIFEEARLIDVPVTPLPIGRKNLAGLAALYRWLSANDVDAVNTHSSTDSWLTALALKLLKRSPPMMRTRHISAPIPRNSPTRWLYQNATRQIVTTGERLRQQLIDDNGYNSARITSIPTGIDLNRYKPGDKGAARAALGLPADGRLIGIVATLRSWKGHRYLIDAFSQLDDDSARLVIIGDGPMRETLQRHIAQLNLETRVTMPGNQRDVLPWLHALDVFVLPSYANEGVPQAIMQAMACRLPVVSTAVGSISEIIKDGQNGLFVEPRNSAALHRAIQRLIEEPDLGRDLAAAGLTDAQRKFGIDKMLDRMEIVFTNVINEHGQSRPL